MLCKHRLFLNSIFQVNARTEEEVWAKRQRSKGRPNAKLGKYLQRIPGDKIRIGKVSCEAHEQNETQAVNSQSECIKDSTVSGDTQSDLEQLNMSERVGVKEKRKVLFFCIKLKN